MRLPAGISWNERAVVDSHKADAEFSQVYTVPQAGLYRVTATIMRQLPVYAIKMQPDRDRKWWQVWKPLDKMQPLIEFEHIHYNEGFRAEQPGVYQLIVNAKGEMRSHRI